MKATLITIIALAVSLAIAIMVAVLVGLGARNLNRELVIKTRSQRGSIVLRDKILGKIKTNSSGKGRIDKIREQLEEWERLKVYEGKGIDPDFSGAEVFDDAE